MSESVSPISTSDAEVSVSAAGSPRKGWLKWVKLALTVLVIVSVGWQFYKLANDWSDNGTAIRDRKIDWYWICVSLASFLIGQIFFAMHWRQLLAGGDYHAPVFATIRAYVVGTLGKYVPGKAFVLVLRSGMLPQSEGRRFEIGLSATYETLAAMSGAGAIGAIAFLYHSLSLPLTTLASIGIAVLLHVAMIPRIFERLSKWVSVPFGQRGKVVKVSNWHRSALRWMPLLIMAWIGSGMSLWALTRSLDMQPIVGSAGSFETIFYLIGCASFATAAGFLVLILPAGLGVREGLLAGLLMKCFGQTPDILIVVLVLRTVWTLGEVLLAGGFYLLPGIGWAGAVAARRIGVVGDN